MAYTQHWLLQLIGTMGTTNPEIWSCGIRLWAESYDGFDEVDYTEGLAKDACAAWVARPGSRISSNCSLDMIKFNEIAPDGSYANPGVTNEYIYPTPVVGQGGPGSLPYQCTVVLSWRTNARERGPASKGRIYSPAPSMVVPTTTGLFAPSDAVAMADSAALFLNTLDITVAGEPFRPSIMSQIGGAHEQIDWVYVDNRVDTQRRRSNALTPATSIAEVLY